jgi:hypothetical protein
MSPSSMIASGFEQVPSVTSFPAWQASSLADLGKRQLKIFL